MGRPHIEFIQAFGVEPETNAPAPFSGCVRRLLSRDEDTAALTALVSAPAGWRTDLASAAAPVELFVLEGRFQLGEHELGAGAYAYVPQTAEAQPLSTTAPGHLLAMVEAPAAHADGGELLVKDTTAMRWAASTFAEVPPGLVNKRLRDDPVTGERTWVAACPPGWTESRAEVHPTVEESFLLRGDILLGRRGGLTPGCYFWRPPLVPHGPMFSRGGAEFFFRTRGGALEVTYETVPEWDALVAAYRESEPIYGPWPTRMGG